MKRLHFGFQILLVTCLLVCESANGLAVEVNQMSDADLHVAANGGNAKAQLKLGETLGSRAVTDGEKLEAIGWIQKAALQGLPEAEYSMGVHYSDGQDVRQNFTEALKWLRLAAHDGNSEAEFRVSLAYAKGFGVTPNLNESTAWALTAAKHGNVHAQYNLGVAYRAGLGIQKNYNESFRWCNQWVS